MADNPRGRPPQYGDEIFIPDGYGTWINGIVNAVGEELLVGVVAGAHASGSQLISVQTAEYFTAWAWPEDMPGQVEN